MPDWTEELRRRLAAFDLPAADELRIIEEMSRHLDDRVSDLQHAGVAAETARRLALDEVSDDELRSGGWRALPVRPASAVTTASPRGSWLGLLDDLLHDLRYGTRRWVGNPAFTAAAVLSLALGIGATTAVFSVADAVLLRPLPGVRAPEELVLIEPDPPRRMLLSIDEARRRLTGLMEGSLSPRERREAAPWPFLDLLRTRDEVIVDASFWTGPSDLWMHLPGQPQESGAPVGVQRVSSAFFQTFGVDVLLGPGFSDEDARAGGSPLAVISHDLWQREFAMAPDVVGRGVVVDGQTLTIAGVAPPAFRGPDAGRRPDLWQLWTDFLAGGRVMARVRRGTSLDEVRAVAAVVSAQAAGDQAASPRAPVVSAGARGWHDTRARLTQPLTILGAAGMLVLLVACANVAGLLLAAGQRRRQELVVRLALGGGRGRLIRQLLTESSVLAVAGGVGGVLIAMWSTQVLARSRLLAMHVPDLALDVGVDLRVLAVAFACGLLSIVIIGLVPAIMLTSLKPDAFTGPPSSQGPASRRALRPGRLLVTAQVALAIVLLVGAGLLLGTLVNLYRIDPGFRTDNTIYLNVARAPWARTRPIDSAVVALLVERLEALPGVQSVGSMQAASGLLSESQDSEDLGVPVRQGPSQTPPGVPLVGETRCFSAFVGPGFFRTMGIRILSGREFRTEDLLGVYTSETVMPVVISQSLANRFFGQQSALGRRVYMAGPVEVIGIVDDAKLASLRQGEQCAVYLMAPPRTQFVLAASGDPASLHTAIAQAVRDVDASLDPRDLRTFGAIVDDSLVRERFVSRLSAVYALIALVMMTIGIYGAVSYSVAQRTREIGIRMALGAQARAIAAMVALETGWMVGAGVVIGCAAAAVTSRALASLLFGVTPADPVIVTLAVLVLLVTAALACWVPARRAARIDPVRSLRAE